MSVELMSIGSYQENARRLRRAGNWSDALSLYRKIESLDPSNWQNYVAMGDTLLNMQDWQAAAEAYQKSLQLREEFDWGWHNLAVAFRQLGQWEDVERCHEKLRVLKPDFWEVNGQVPLVAQHLNAFLAYKDKKTGLAAASVDLAVAESSPTELSTPESNTDESNTASLSTDSPTLAPAENVTAVEPQDLEEPGVRENDVPIKKIFRVASNLVFVVAELGEKLPDAAVTVKSAAFEIPFYAFKIASAPKDVLFAAIADTTHTDDLRISLYSQSTSSESHHLKCMSHTEVLQGLDLLIEELEVAEAKSLLSILCQLGQRYPKWVENTALAKESRKCQQLTNVSELLLEHGAWLLPSILYFEISITDDRWLLGTYDLAVIANDKLSVVKCHNFQIDNTQLSGVAIFEHDIYTEPYREYWLTFLLGDTSTTLNKPITLKQYSLEFVQHLSRKSDFQRGLMQEQLSKAIIMLSHAHDNRSDSVALVKKLQRYVPFNPVNAVDPELPFQIFFDQVIPVGCDGIFVSGWMHDPYESLDEIEAITALGFRFSVKAKYVYRTERQDVREHLSSTRYGRFDAKPGFFAYIQADDETRTLLQGFDQFHNVRFCMRLKDKIAVDVTPDIKFCDVFTARSIVSQIVPPDQVSEDMLQHCIGPAAAKLQSLCMEKIKIQKVIDIGTPCENPETSIIIPLYKRLDFIKVQIPLFANDPTLKKSEIIYVLDSPWQAQELTTFLQEQCQLYQLPVKLVIMKRNSGYSSSNNAGASQANGKYLLLMNSDVFPRSSGWIEKMLSFYQSSEKIGTLGAKLVYEDGSIQHAGMFFERTTFPFWLTLHYYKGFPNKYQPANYARAVPSVTGACLLISKALFDRVDGMSTEYLIGDFEDSDLCFKCVSEGYENWYCPDAEFYHLERQSVPLNASYSGSLAWHHNARLHEKKWGELIGKTMEEIG